MDGPPRMVGWITWSGRERSSQTQFLPVPGVWLIHPTTYPLKPHEWLQSPEASERLPLYFEIEVTA